MFTLSTDLGPDSSPLDPYDDDDDAAGGPQWDTQFLHGDDNDGIEDFEEEGLTPGEEKNLSVNMTGEEEDLLAATRGQLKRVRPDNVNYAKRAKRVDVKKLKDSIWKELEVVTIKVKEVRSLFVSFFLLPHEIDVPAFTRS